MSEVKENITEIDVEKIMEEIRADIREKGYTADMIRFQDVAIPISDSGAWDQTGFEELVNSLNIHWDISWYRPLAGGRGKIFIKRVVRKIISIVMKPIVEEQHVYNMELVQTFNQLKEYIRLQEEKNQELEEEIKFLKQESAVQGQK